MQTSVGISYCCLRLEQNFMDLSDEIHGGDEHNTDFSKLQKILELYQPLQVYPLL